MRDSQPTQPENVGANRDSTSEMDSNRPARAGPNRATASESADRVAGADHARGADRVPSRRPGLRARFRYLRARVRALPFGGTVLKIVVGVTGGVFVALGLILVPLPGPGWAIVFGGLAIWAIEFVWAQHLLNWVRRQVRAGTAQLMRLPWPLRVLLGVAVVVALLTAGWLWIKHRYGFETISQFWEYLRTH
jgi:uncharacterized protein (TIGR02611 family)